MGPGGGSFPMRIVAARNIDAEESLRRLES